MTHPYVFIAGCCLFAACLLLGLALWIYIGATDPYEDGFGAMSALALVGAVLWLACSLIQAAISLSWG